MYREENQTYYEISMEISYLRFQPQLCMGINVR